MSMASLMRHAGSHSPWRLRHFSSSSAYVMFTAVGRETAGCFVQASLCSKPSAHMAAGSNFRIFRAADALFSLISCLGAESSLQEDLSEFG